MRVLKAKIISKMSINVGLIFHNYNLGYFSKYQNFMKNTGYDYCKLH